MTTNNKLNELSEASSIDSPFMLRSKRDYTKVPEDKRLQLLKIIQNEQLTIKTAARRLGINYSTAKNIVKIFRCEKRVTILPKKAGESTAKQPDAAPSITESRAEEEIPAVKRFVAKKTKLYLDNTEFVTHFDSPALAPMAPAVTKHRTEGSLPTARYDAICFDFSVYGSLILTRYTCSCLLA